MRFTSSSTLKYIFPRDSQQESIPHVWSPTLKEIVLLGGIPSQLGLNNMRMLDPLGQTRRECSYVDISCIVHVTVDEFSTLLCRYSLTCIIHYITRSKLYIFK